MEVLSTVSAKITLALLAAVFATDAWMAATRPITSAEALTYERFVRPPLRETLHQRSRNSEVLYTILEKRSVGLFRVSEFSVRFPSLLAGSFYLWAIWRLCRHPVLLIPIAIAPVAWQCFSTANGLGVALALSAWAIEAVPRKLERAGVYLGLSVAAHLSFAVPAALIGAIIVARNFQWHRAVEVFLIPALVTSFIVLVLPMSLAPHPQSLPPELGAESVKGVHSAVEALRLQCGTKPIRVVASPDVLPVLSFYRSRYRLSSWQLTDVPADYHVLPESAITGQMTVLHRDGGIVLAQ